MKRDRFFGDGIACDIFCDEKREGKYAGLGVYLYGFPGSIGENEITQRLVASGLVVIQPHFPGTYDSSGLFTPASGISMFEKVARTIKSEGVTSVKSGRILSVPRGPTVCVAHSFGCFPALRGAGELPELRSLVLLGPAIAYGSGTSGCGLVEDGSEHIAYVKRSRPFTFRLGNVEEWMALYAGELDLGEPRSVPSIRRVLGLIGEKDAYFRVDVLKARFEPLVRHYVGSAPVLELEVVAGAGHGPKGLLGSEHVEAVVATLGTG